METFQWIFIPELDARIWEDSVLGPYLNHREGWNIFGNFFRIRSKTQSQGELVSVEVAVEQCVSLGRSSNPNQMGENIMLFIRRISTHFL